MRIRSKIVSLAVVAALIVISIPSFIFKTNKESAEKDIIKKISFGLTEKKMSSLMGNLSNKADYIAAFNEVCDTDSVGGGMQALIAYSYDITEDNEYGDIFDKAQSVSTPEEELEYRKELNAFSKEYHQTANYIYSEDLRDNGLSFKTYDYAPYALAEIHDDEIDAEVFWSLAASENVSMIEFIDLDPEFCTPEAMDEINSGGEIAPMAISSPSSLDSLSGVLKRIGMSGVDASNKGGMARMGLWEADGVPTLSSFPDENYRMFNYAGDMPNTHADQVASTIFAVAPMVTLYSKRVTSDMDLSWFAQNYCTSINMSFAQMYLNSPISSYDAVCGLLDYQLYSLRISAFAAAGNTTTYYISRPATARNLLAVTGTRAEQYGEIIYEYLDGSATYMHNNQYAKPNIAAPYTIKLDKYGYLGGTSFSTPIVSAAAALMITNNWALSVQPEQLYARLIAGANHPVEYATYWPSGFSKKIGAGTLNVGKAISAVSSSANSNCDLSGGIFRQVTLPVRKTSIPIALFIISPRYDAEEYYSNYSLQISYIDYNGIPGSYYNGSTCCNYRLYRYDDVEKYADFLTFNIIQTRYRGGTISAGGVLDHIGWAYCG